MPAYPYNPDGATFECGQAVQNDANVVFVSAARFDAARCGKEIQATSAYYSPFRDYASPVYL